MSDTRCSNCGNLLTESGKFCGICGAPRLPQEESAPECSNAIPVQPDDASAVPESVTIPIEPQVDAVISPSDTVSAEPKTESSVDALPPRPGKWTRRSAIRTVFAVLLCVLIFVFSFVALSLFTFRTTTVGSQSEKAFRSMLYDTDLTRISAASVFTNLEDKDISLAAWFLGVAAEINPDFDDVSHREFREYWEKSVIPEQLSAVLSKNLHSIYSGSSAPVVTATDLADILEQDIRNIRKAFGIELTEEDANQLADRIADYGLLDQFSVDTLKLQSPAAYCGIQICASVWILAIFGFLILREILLLLKINRSILRTCSDTGITLMVMGGIWCVAGLWIAFLPNTWLSVFNNVQPLGAVLGEFISSGLPYAGIIFGFGLILLAVKIIGKKIVVKPEKVQV